jgi:hypothetical protein
MERQAPVEMEEIPAKLSGNELSFSRSDWWFTAAMGAIAQITQTQTNALGFAVVVLIWAGLMKRLTNGRTYRVIVKKFKSFWRMKVKKGKVYVTRSGERAGADDDSLPSATKVDRRAAKAQRRYPIPFVVNSLPRPEPSQNVGVLHIPGNKTDSIIFSGRGADTVSRSPLEIKRAGDALSEELKGVASSQRGFSVGISMVYRRDPHNRFKLEQELEEILHPQAVIPDGIFVNDEDLTADQKRWLVTSQAWNEVREIEAEYTYEPWMGYVITIKREGILARAESSRAIRTKDLKRLPINRIADRFLRGLNKIGVTDPYVLDKARTHAFVRAAWDYAGIDDYYRLLAEDPENAMSPSLHWPTEMRVGKGFANPDTTHTRIIRITGTQSMVWDGYFRKLMSTIQSPCFSMALVGETVKAQSEEFGLERLTAVIDILADLAGRTTKTRKAQDRDLRLNKRLDVVHASLYSQAYSIVLAIKETDLDELELQVDDVISLAENDGMKGEVIEEPDDQYSAMWSATTGLPLL